MDLLRRILRPRKPTPQDREAEAARLDARRRHLRGRMSETSTRIRRAWTEYRTWNGEEAGKKKLKQEIKHLEARRKAMVKEMLRLQSEMKKLGYDAAAGRVDPS